MLTFKAFAGINNVAPTHRKDDTDLVSAVNVDIGLTGEVTRRAGYSEVSDQCHKNLHNSAGYQLATVGSVLTAIHPNGDRHTIHPALGPSRVWYCDLPDGRTTYSNGLIHGITDGLTGTEWSIPAPDRLGALDAESGALHAGSYRYHLTYVRLADMLEGPATSSEPFDIASGGFRVEALPARDGYAINVYLSGKDGEGAYLADATVGTTFSFAGSNSELVTPCRTLGLRPMPVGTITAFWNGRLLVADGKTLWASMPWAPHLNAWRDFKPFTADITLIQPVAGGVFVGTEQDLIYLGGDTFDQLVYVAKSIGPVVRGSGVTAPGDKIKLGDGVGLSGEAMLCIAGGAMVAGFSGGSVARLTYGRYHTAVAEVAATFREVNGIPQYVAIPQ